jgi:hypothetical protein
MQLLFAEYGNTCRPKSWTPPAQYAVKLQQLDALKQQLFPCSPHSTISWKHFTAGGMMDKDV